MNRDTGSRINRKTLHTAVIIVGIAIVLVVALLVWLLVFPHTGSSSVNSTEATTAADVEEHGLGKETGADGHIDFTVLQKENPDIFAWIYVPGTNIDGPILQSEQSDTYYSNHGADGTSNEEGAFYTELANLRNMCDFNTVINGQTNQAGTAFSELHNFADPDFFKEHEQVMIYLPGNALTYEVYAAYEMDKVSLIRSYDFTYISGCQKFIDEMYDTKDMGKNLREGWDELTPYNFVVTLTTNSQTNPDKQYVVIATLIGDAAGTIDRAVYE